MRASWVIVLVAACGGGGVKDIKDTPAPAAEATCRDAGAKLIELVVAGQAPAPPDDAVNKLITLVENRCATDGWNAAARACFAKVKTVEDADACTKNLSQTELANLSGDMSPPGGPEGASTGAAPEADGGGAPGGAKGGPTRSAKPKDDGADPCDGGE